MTKIRQPIVTVAGHVDHGKTSILDKIRGTSVQVAEAGGITQKISFTTLPKEEIQKRSGEILDKFKIPLEIPGLLFIDTPGHAAFTNLRKRGGSLADLAVLVIDINDGIKPQTAEVINILKVNKTPFIVALNKVDNISGWKTDESKLTMKSVENQAANVKEVFEERYYTLVGALHNHGFEAELYHKVEDFTKKLAVVPCSAKTGEGINEIVAMIAALTQKFLKERIKVGKKGKGVVLEVRKEKGINYTECILYDGNLKKDDSIAIASFEKTIESKVRSIQNSKPLGKGYVTAKEVSAAAGMCIQLTSKEEILPGMPFQVIDNDLEEIEKEFSRELSEEVAVDREGIVVKADSLGSLEALLALLGQKGIRVIRAGIGPITKKDVYSANILPEQDRAILGFNSPVLEEAEVDELKNVKVLTSEVVYKLIEDFGEWKKEKLKEIEREKLSQLPGLAKITVLDFVFRNSNPAVFGVKVEGGVLRRGVNLINKDDEKIGTVKEIQDSGKGIKEAKIASEVAISVPGVNFERQLSIDEALFTNLSESQFRKFKEHRDLLNSQEKSVLQEISGLKRRYNSTWGI